MSTLLHNVLPIIGRVLAGAVGCYCFYVALFMYKDEREQWQNRLDAVWLEIYDRAKKTESIFKALVNDLAALLVRASDLAFGPKAISLKLVTVSAYSSLAVGLSLSYWAHPYGAALLYWDINTPAWGLVIISVCMTLVAIWSPKEWVYPTLLAILIIYCTVELGADLYAATGINPFDLNEDPLSPSSSISTIRSHFPSIFKLYSADYAVAMAMQLALVLSVVFNVVALIVIRRLFRSLAITASVSVIVFGGIILIVIAIAACPLPEFIALHFGHVDLRSGYQAYASMTVTPSIIRTIFIENLAAYIAMMNATTFIYCVSPCAMLTGLRLHKGLWPLARFTYPLLDYKLLTEKVFLLPIGTMAFALAFGYSTVSDLLKKWLTH